MHQTIFATATILLGALLAGCVGDTTPDRPAPAVAPPDGPYVEVRIPEGAFDPRHTGDWYTLPDTTLAGPITIRWVNDDTVFHRVLGLPLAEAVDPRPAWLTAMDTTAAGHDHGGDHAHDGHGDGDAHDEETHDGGHAHGGDAGGHAHGTQPVFDIDLEAGQTLDMLLDHEGTLAIHCHPHPWMEDTWTFLPKAPREHPVVQNSLSAGARLNGTLTNAEEHQTDLAVAAPDLVQFTARLDWDDSNDDVLSGGDATNRPDTFRIDVLAPNGTVVAEAEETARAAALTVSYTVATRPWPTTVPGHTHAEAIRNLQQIRPADTSATGTWIVRVTLVSAPGITDDPGDALATGAFDGSQDWRLQVQTVHVWGEARPPGAPGEQQGYTASLA